MKTLKIALVLLLSTFLYNNADAQILRNSFLIGGSLNFDHSSGKTTISPASGPDRTANEPTSTLFGIEPRFGYFVADNFCIGLNLDFRLNSNTADYPIGSGPNAPVKSLTTTTTRLITGPFIRYYAPLSENVYAFGEVSFGGGLDSRIVSDTTNNNLPESVTVSNLQLGVGPGLNFFLNDYVAFEALAKYTYSQSTFTALGAKNQTIGNNIRFTVGLQIYFRAITAGIKE